MRFLRPDSPTATQTRRQFLNSHVRRSIILGLITALWLAPMLLAAAWIRVRTSHAPSSTTASASSVASQIAHDSQTTSASYAFTAPASSDPSVPIGAYFTPYYAEHGGAALLGPPITPVYPIAGGWIQFFDSGALVLPTQQGTNTHASQAIGALTQNILAGSVRDAVTGVIRLPLAQPLLRAGSLVTVAGAGTPTFADLRPDVISITLTPAHSAYASSSSGGEPSFSYQQDGQPQTGEIIPQPIWQFMNRADVAPDGWQADIGLPLTLPVSMMVSASDGIHEVQVQCFYHATLVVDDGVEGVAPAPAVSSLPTGLAYLQTLGAPDVSTSTARQAWVTNDAPVLNAPATGQQQAGLGQNFPVAFTGDARWIGDELWYAVAWSNLHAHGDGWLNADVLSFASPATDAPVWSSFDTLSPELAGYLRSLGGNTGAVVYDETRHHYYTYNMSGEYTVASSMKVPILLTFLAMTESQGREPNADEMYLLQTMIENSDNDSAQALFLEVGGMGPIQAMLGRLHISGFEPNYDEWGWSTIPPLAMVQMLTALHDGTVLTAQDRGLALSLMSQIESDQQTGVGSTAPQGASYWMKDGWVPAPDGLWAMNSSGIVTRGSETYIIAVYSQEQTSLDDGWAIAEHVCGAVAQLLTS